MCRGEARSRRGGGGSALTGRHIYPRLCCPRSCTPSWSFVPEKEPIITDLWCFTGDESAKPKDRVPSTEPAHFQTPAFKKVCQKAKGILGCIQSRLGDSDIGRTRSCWTKSRGSHEFDKDWSTSLVKTA